MKNGIKKIITSGTMLCYTFTAMAANANVPVVSSVEAPALIKVVSKEYLKTKAEKKSFENFMNASSGVMIKDNGVDKLAFVNGNIEVLANYSEIQKGFVTVGTSRVDLKAVKSYSDLEGLAYKLSEGSPKKISFFESSLLGLVNIAYPQAHAFFNQPGMTTTILVALAVGLGAYFLGKSKGKDEGKEEAREKAKKRIKYLREKARESLGSTESSYDDYDYEH